MIWLIDLCRRLTIRSDRIGGIHRLLEPAFPGRHTVLLLSLLLDASSKQADEEESMPVNTFFSAKKARKGGKGARNKKIRSGDVERKCAGMPLTNANLFAGFRLLMRAMHQQATTRPKRLELGSQFCNLPK